MHVLDSISTRRTVRSFNARRPSRLQIESILRTASRAPSIQNNQSWRVHVFAENALADLVNLSAAAEQQVIQTPPLWRPGMNLANTEIAAMRRGGLRFYEAPVGLICTIKRNAAKATWLEHGGFINNIQLAANAYALSTCLIGDYAGIEDTIADVVPIPPDEEITVGIGIGYADNPKEKLTTRDPLDAFTTFYWH